MSAEPTFFGMQLTIDEDGSYRADRSAGAEPFSFVAGYNECFQNWGWALMIATCDWTEVVDSGIDDSLIECVRHAEDAARRVVREGAKQVGVEG